MGNTSHTSQSLHSQARDMQRVPRSQTRFRVAIPRVNPGSEPVQPPPRSSPGSWRGGVWTVADRRTHKHSTQYTLPLTTTSPGRRADSGATSLGGWSIGRQRRSAVAVIWNGMEMVWYGMGGWGAARLHPTPKGLGTEEARVGAIRHTWYGKGLKSQWRCHAGLEKWSENLREENL